MARDRARNTLNQARQLTLTSTPQTFRDFVGDTDKHDLYSFKLGDRSSVDLQLTGIRKNSNVDVELYTLKGDSATTLRRIGKIDFSNLSPAKIRSNLVRLARLARRGRADESLTQTLEAGTYYLRVYPNRGDSTYTLTLSASALTNGSGNPDGTGNPGTGDPGTGTDPSGNPVPTKVISPDFSTWSRIGDVLFNPTPSQTVTLTNAAALTPTDDATIQNVSGFFPLTKSGTGDQNFAQAIGLTSNQQLNTGLNIGPSGSPAGDGYAEGSAVRNPAIAANAGDTLKFNWSFSLKDEIDLGFVKVGTTLFRLQGTSPFSYTFPTAGTYDIAIGVIDVNSFRNSSILQLSLFT